MLFIYLFILANVKLRFFGRNSVYAYLKSQQARWAADKALGISPQAGESTDRKSGTQRLTSTSSGEAGAYSAPQRTL